MSTLLDLCVRELNALNKLGLIVMEDMDVVPAETGKLMARYYIAFNTMSLFSKVIVSVVNFLFE